VLELQSFAFGGLRGRREVLEVFWRLVNSRKRTQLIGEPYWRAFEELSI